METYAYLEDLGFVLSATMMLKSYEMMKQEEFAFQSEVESQ